MKIEHNDETLELSIYPPFGPDEKVYFSYDGDGTLIWGPFSFNEYMKVLKDMSGINTKILGEA